VTLEELGNLGELIAAVATVLTLAYLALQIRQNTEQLKNSGRDARTSASVAYTQIEQSFLLQLGLNPDAGAVYFKGLADFESLDDKERTQFIWLLSAYLTNFRQSFYLNQEGVMTDGLWSQHQASIEWVVSQPGFRPYWKAWGGVIVAEVAELVEAILAEPTHEQSAARDSVGH
jgi:hypothetical protein